ncbi:hypothetical protein TNCV_1138571 [Trichonephila clavipes]|nr:hypothetical protein TNCV_1138571 [Trichonephila clavipes]
MTRNDLLSYEIAPYTITPKVKALYAFVKLRLIQIFGPWPLQTQRRWSSASRVDELIKPTLSINQNMKNALKGWPIKSPHIGGLHPRIDPAAPSRWIFMMQKICEDPLGSHFENENNLESDKSQ